MKRGTAAKVILGKDTLMDVPAGIVFGTDVILGGKAGLINDFNGLVLSNNVLLGKKISHSTIISVIVRGQSPLILPDAIANSLQYVKAFGGTEQRDIPDNYLQRQYIYMLDGSYLLTDIVPTYDSKVEFDFQTTTLASGATTYLGVRPGSSGNGGLRVAKVSSLMFRVYGFSDEFKDSAIRVKADTRYKFVWNNQSAVITSGGSEVFNGTFDGTDANTYPVAINGWNTAGTVTPGAEGIYVYGFKAWNAQGELVADYIPAIQKGTVPVVGFYDTVSKTFKTATAGTFAAGPEAVPTPDAPMDIVSNNGVLRIPASATGTGSQTGTPTPTTPIYPVFYQKGNLVLRAVGTYADTYDATTQTITRNVGVKVFDGTEEIKGHGTIDGLVWEINNNVSAGDTAIGICSHYNFTTAGIVPMPSGNFRFAMLSSDQRIVFKDAVHASGTGITAANNFKAYLAAQYAAGTPVTVYYPLATPITESFTPSVYADGTVETINAHRKNLFNKDANWGAWYPSTSNTIASGGANRTVVIRCLPNTKYYFKHCTYRGGLRAFYTEEENWDLGSPCSYTGVVAGDANVVYSITTSANAKWLFVCFGRSDSSTTATYAQQASDYMLSIEELTSATAYEPYYDGGTATAEMLLKVGDYQDEQEILSGAVTRSIRILVLTGDESWTRQNPPSGRTFYTYNLSLDSYSGAGYLPNVPYCTHLQRTTATGRGNIPDNGIGVSANTPYTTLWLRCDTYESITDWTNFLKAQYNAGTPVIVVYPLATPTTESVTGQTLQVTGGDNVLEITQASLTGLELEAQYNTLVQLTVQEVQDANLDNDVTVTII